LSACLRKTRAAAKGRSATSEARRKRRTRLDDVDPKGRRKRKALRAEEQARGAALSTPRVSPPACEEMTHGVV
jgi:hypothetical protein